MNSTYTKSKPILGMDQSLFPEDNRAFEISNFRQDENGGWHSSVGWEPLIPTNASETIPISEFRKTYSPVRFLACWKRHEGSEPYYLYERGNELRYDWGNKGLGSSRAVILKNDRIDPKADNPGTQIAPFKNFALLLNGVNAPIKFWGREVIEPFGWNRLPATPTIFQPQANAIDTVTTHYLEAQSSNVYFPKTTYYGVGDGAKDARNSCGYRVAFLSKTGSMSPLSEPFFVSWTIDATTDEGKMGIILTDVAIGPDGTVARLIFRTKNKKDGLTSQLDDYYLVSQINENVSKTFIDFLPDSELNTTPVDLQSSAPIDNGYKYATAFDNCMFLAGGEAHPTKIIYSSQSLPEQFPTFNYFDVGVREGGHITALFPYYNSLLVFRERSIDIINKTASGYQISTMDPFVGTTATNTIKYVPDVGVCFLAKDGIYSINGGIVGGSVHKAKNISAQLSDEWGRLSTGALARASATFSEREQEYWCHYPADGQTENIRGAVYHCQTKGWSLRNCEDFETGEMKFTQLATDGSGWIILGTYPTWSIITATASSWPGIGLQVWSHNPYWGKKWTYVSTGQSDITLSTSNQARGNSRFVSVWENMGDNGIKKSVEHVIVEGLSQGNNPVGLSWFVDGGFAGTAAGSVAPIQADYYDTTSSQSTLATSPANPTAVWGTSLWEKSKMIAIRWDTGSEQTTSFRFEIATSDYIHILMYKLGYTTTGQRTINQRG
jgi:hypothetical protein